MPNLKKADFAIEAYDKKLDEVQVAQLTFFRALWAEQNALRAELAPDYRAPSSDTIKKHAQAQTPILRVFPAGIDAPRLARAGTRMAAALCREGGYPPEACAQIEAIDWERVAKASACYAGSNPELCLETAYRALLGAGADDAVAQLATLALSLGLRALLEPAANAVMTARAQAEVAMLHPVSCPTCGCGATIASVGASSAGSGGARQLYCAQCGTVWDFDRIRCARCGTRNQGHLHYHHIGDDDAHRIHTCDECHGYIRTVFQEDIFAPIALEVEDVVMARLDQVAQKLVEE